MTKRLYKVTSTRYGQVLTIGCIPEMIEILPGKTIGPPFYRPRVRHILDYDESTSQQLIVEANLAPDHVLIPMHGEGLLSTESVIQMIMVRLIKAVEEMTVKEIEASIAKALEDTPEDLGIKDYSDGDDDSEREVAKFLDAMIKGAK